MDKDVEMLKWIITFSVPTKPEEIKNQRSIYYIWHKYVVCPPPQICLKIMDYLRVGSNIAGEAPRDISIKFIDSTGEYYLDNLGKSLQSMM